MSPPSADDYDDDDDNHRRHSDDGHRGRHHHPNHHRSGAPPPPPSKKFDLRLNPPYQIDFANVAAGKTIAATKRRVRFRFGFSDLPALEEGKVGVDCRGEEHEVVVVISALSGKRHVYADGHEVHFSYGNRTDSTFETSWTMKGGHLVKVRGHVALPLFETPGFRQFDLTIDGLSYFAMPKQFELGIKKPATATRLALPRSVSPSRGDADQGYEEASYDGEYGSRRRRSTPDHRPSAAARDSEPSRKQHESVVSMDEPVDILSDASMALSLSSSSDLLSSTAGATPGLLMDRSDALAGSARDEFAPVEAPPLSPANQFASVSSSILSQYGPSSSAYQPTTTNGGVLALANESHTYYAPPPPQQQQQQHQPAASAYYPPTHQQQQPSYGLPPVTPSHSSVQSPQSYYGAGAPAPSYNYGTPNVQQQQQQYPPYSQPQRSSYYAPVSPEGSVRSVTTTTMEESSGSFDPSPVKLTMQPLTLEEVDEVLMHEEGMPMPKRPLTDVDKAMASLVNLGDIKENKLTPEQRKAMQAKELKLQAKKKSQPAPPSAPTWRMGDSATLGDLQQTPKDDKNKDKGPKKEIMRTHAFDPRAVHAGMMVVYGTDPNSVGGGIPPSQGFGAGAGAAAMSPQYASRPYHHPHQPQ
jgi:hypothetical protein